MSTFTVTIDLPHPPADLFRFLAEPRNRPLWQSSLRTVTDVDEGEPHAGQHWRDVTKAGIKPQMQLTDGLLTLRFLKTALGTRITAEGRLIGHGAFALAAAVSGRWAPETIRKDLLRASAVLTDRRGRA